MSFRLLPGLALLFGNACIASMADQTLATKHESFPAVNVTFAQLETGAGSLTIHGRQGATSIEVEAVYKGNARSQEDIQRILENLKLTTELRGSTFSLKTEQTGRQNWTGDSGSIDLIITLPPSLALDIDDGSGSVVISGMGSNVRIEDGSGSIELGGIAGNVTVEDGSGSIRIHDINGGVEIHDGSGEIDIRHVGGTVRIHDGSGSISVEDLDGDFIVAGDGSGSIHHSGVRGKVDIPRRK